MISRITAGPVLLIIRLAMAVALLLPGRQAAAADALPPQPLALTVVHRSGQTFITWPERADLSAERYRIYRADAPITAQSLDAVALLYEVAEGSAIFFANRYADYASPPKWQYRYAERLVVQDGGSPLPVDTGVLVWTIGPADLAVSSNAYYAVTTVAEGVENRAEFAAGNQAGPVAEGIDRPQPVRFTAPTGWEVYIQYRDLRNWNPTFHAPNPLNGYYGLNATDYGVSGAVQYAYDVGVHVPDPAACGGSLPARLPLFLSLHAWGGDHYGPAGAAPAGWCAYIVAPVDQSETWWFGFARAYDYRKGGEPQVGDTIVNYTEQRVLDALDFLLRQPPGPPVDPQRIYVNGHSMVGGGSLALAWRYPSVFAAANASKPVTDHRTSGWTFSTIARWGRPELNLPVQIDAPNGWAEHLEPYVGMGVWDWQNLQADPSRRPGEARTPLGLDFGINDTAVPWSAQGAPVFGPLEESRQSWAARVGNDGHNWGAYGGLGPNYRLDGQGAPFAGLRAVRNESVPAFSAVSGDPALPPTAAGAFHHTLYWSSSWTPWDGAPVDTSSMWRVSVCTVAAEAAQPVCGTGPAITADITPRRLQAFTIAPLAAYPWAAQAIASGQIVAQGVAQASAGGVLTVPHVPIPPTGVRLTVRAPGFSATPAIFLPLVATQ
jgi:hypothetical protein